jgi:phosphoglycerate dehydrogenase-like enzyme
MRRSWRADVLLGWRPPRNLAQRAPRLRWAQSLTGGMEGWLASSDLPSALVLTCARGTHRVQMPEHILAGLFIASKQLAPIVLDQRERRWTPPDESRTRGHHTRHPRPRCDRRGSGAQGGRARPAGHSARSATASRWAHVTRVWGPDGTDAVLEESDFVVLLLPSHGPRRAIC